MRLAPSILSFDLSRPREFLPQLAAVGAEVIHLDVMDGSFVPPITFGGAYVQALRSIVDTPFEAHLMIEHPETQFRTFADAGCSRVIFHAEATRHAHRLVHELRALGLEAGLAINPGTPVEAIGPLVDDLDLALVMTVDPGWGGQAIIGSTIAKIEELRRLRSDLLIEVDGGIEPETIARAESAGADLFVVGSFLARAPDLKAAVARLEAAMC